MTDEKKQLIKELRFAIHVPEGRNNPDLHLLKEIIHHPDGTVEPKLRWIKNYERQFWITDLSHRSYKQKKEIEHHSKLTTHRCTQSHLREKAAEALGMGWSRESMKKISNSPYLYGSEIRSTALLKKLYQTKNTTHNTPYSVMQFDIETDMVNGTDDPIITTAVFGNQIYVGVTKDFLKGLSSPETSFRDSCRQYLGEFTNHPNEVSRFNIGDYAIIFEVANGTVDLIKKTFVWVHSKKPDFLAIWNMDFDIPRIMNTLVKYNEDPGSVLCDPSVPYQARVCKYMEGIKKKRKANGQEVPLEPSDQWHSLLLTASFYVVDAMCVYRLLRIAKQKDSSYSLDAILNKELGLRKLKFKEADAYKKGEWHTFMQSNYKIEYLVYALFDSLGMKLLDDKIMDIKFAFPNYASITDFSKANSKPRMIADALHFYTLEKGYVLNSIGEQLDFPSYVDDEEEEDENAILSLKNWIMTLPAHLVTPGLALIEESPLIRTKLRAFCYDSDCVSAYPVAASILNVSKGTTRREIVNIDTIEETTFRLQNINLSSGNVNALEYGHTMFGLPSLDELADIL